MHGGRLTLARTAWEQEQMDTLLAGRWLSEYEEKTAAPIGDPWNQNNHDNAYNN
jgi:hypothetical protein